MPGLEPTPVLCSPLCITATVAKCAAEFEFHEIREVFVLRAPLPVRVHTLS